MEGIMILVQPFFGWLLQTSLIASVIICLILAAQKTLGGRLGPRWCHALWLVLLIRMVLPWAPSSRLSLSNLIPSWDRQVGSQQSPKNVEQQEPSVSTETAEYPEVVPEGEPQSEAAVQESIAPRPDAIVNAEDKSEPRLVSIGRLLPIFLVGRRDSNRGVYCPE